MAIQDIILNEDIAISNGDLYVYDSDNQHAEHILQAMPGQFYQSPTIGAGMYAKTLVNVKKPRIEKLIRSNMKKDNMRVDELDIYVSPNGDFEINLTVKRLK